MLPFKSIYETDRNKIKLPLGSIATNTLKGERIPALGSDELVKDKFGFLGEMSLVLQNIYMFNFRVRIQESIGKMQ